MRPLSLLYYPSLSSEFGNVNNFVNDGQFSFSEKFRRSMIFNELGRSSGGEFTKISLSCERLERIGKGQNARSILMKKNGNHGEIKSEDEKSKIGEFSQKLSNTQEVKHSQQPSIISTTSIIALNEHKGPLNLVSTTVNHNRSLTFYKNHYDHHHQIHKIIKTSNQNQATTNPNRPRLIQRILKSKTDNNSKTDEKSLFFGKARTKLLRFSKEQKAAKTLGIVMGMK